MEPAAVFDELPPAEAWEPLSPGAFDAGAAAHLLRRASFAATPPDVARAVSRGLDATLEDLLAPRVWPKPEFLKRLPEKTAAILAEASSREQGRDAVRREYVAALQRLGVEWVSVATLPGHASTEKLTLFLADVFVVAAPKVRDPGRLFLHHEILRAGLASRLGTLAKAVSRSPAMVEYLDLQRSREGEPNENFARELFELFLLGEGNYTEADIKEAARAFTGYRAEGHRFVFVPRAADPGRKTIFGKSGAFTGDDVIDLALRQPAASTFIPGELARFALGDEITIPAAHLEALGREWAATEFSMPFLLRTFFGSRLFFHAAFRGTAIKSPVQLLAGLVLDLGLDPLPIANPTLRLLRQMGQTPYSPPNVRGWVGGRHWINSATVTARRELVRLPFRPLREETLNADDLIELDLARASGRGNFSFDEDRLEGLAERTDADLLDHAFTALLARPPTAEVRDAYRAHLASPGGRRVDKVRTFLTTLLESPDYQLC